MSVITETVAYGLARQRSGLLARVERAKAPLPAIVVLQEAWGVDDHIAELTRRLALAGYAAFAPDLYATNGARPPELTRERTAEVRAFIDALPQGAVMDPAKREAALAQRPGDARERISKSIERVFAGAMGLDRFVEALLDTTRFLRHECDVTRGQPIVSVGFCMGGGLSALLACHDPELRGAVMFYGRAPSEELVARIACPVLAFYGGLDARINDGIPALEGAMKKHGKRFEHHVFDGAQHAFFNDTRPAYDVRAARVSFARTLSFFGEAIT